jgi:hypothetical protein
MIMVRMYRSIYNKAGNHSRCHLFIAFNVSSPQTSFSAPPLYFAPVWHISCLVTAAGRRRRKRNDLITKSQGEGMDIVLCWDVSGAGVPEISFLPARSSKAGAAEFIPQPSRRPASGLYIFRRSIYTSTSFTTDKNTLLETDSITESGITSLDGTVDSEKVIGKQR